MIYLDKNENLYGPAPECLKLVCGVSVEDFACYRRNAHGGLQERLSEIYGLPENALMLTYGNEDLLKRVFAAVGDGDSVLLPACSWWYYDALVQQRMARCEYYRLCEGKESYSVDFESLLVLEKACKPKLTVICSPNNPTGNSFSLEYLEELLRVNQDRVVFFDETYWGFAAQDSTPELLRLLRLYDNLLVGRSFSKYYALAGMRIGFAFLGKRVKELLGFYDPILGFSYVLEKLAVAALKSSEYYRNIAELIMQERDALAAQLRMMQSVFVYRSEANFLFVRFPKEWILGLDARLRAQGLQVKFFSEGFFAGASRIAVGPVKYSTVLLREIQEYLRVEGT